MAEHDQLFKRTFRIPKHAAGELRAVLPPRVLDAIDLDSLELLQSDLVGARLDERFSDALFKAMFRGTEGYLWLLLEHQSEPEHFMVLRVLEYLVRSWGELLRREPTRRTLPPVVCVVVHHGESGWSPPTRLRDLIEGLAAMPELAPFVPDFEIVVDDLVARSDADLGGRPLGTLPKVVLWALRDARTITRFYEHLSAWAAELGRLMIEAPEDASTVLRYILEVAGDQSFDTFRQRITEAAPAAEASMTTFAEQLIQRGRTEGKVEGRVEGRAEGKAEAVLAVLAARGLRLNDDERVRVAECRDAAELDRWLSRAVTVKAGSEIF